MKNIKLPEDLQKRVILYMQYQQSTLDQQKELEKFF